MPTKMIDSSNVAVGVDLVWDEKGGAIRVTVSTDLRAFMLTLGTRQARLLAKQVLMCCEELESPAQPQDSVPGSAVQKLLKEVQEITRDELANADDFFKFLNAHEKKLTQLLEQLRLKPPAKGPPHE